MTDPWDELPRASCQDRIIGAGMLLGALALLAAPPAKTIVSGGAPWHEWAVLWGLSLALFLLAAALWSTRTTVVLLGLGAAGCAVLGMGVASLLQPEEMITVTGRGPSTVGQAVALGLLLTLSGAALVSVTLWWAVRRAARRGASRDGR